MKAEERFTVIGCESETDPPEDVTRRSRKIIISICHHFDKIPFGRYRFRSEFEMTNPPWIRLRPHRWRGVDGARDGARCCAELPWERAHGDDARYAAWAAAPGAPAAPDPAAAGPWRKLSGGALALLGAALAPEPARRATLDQLLRHPWMSEHDELPDHKHKHGTCPPPAPPPPPHPQDAAPARVVSGTR